MPTAPKSRHGFTLLELLLVVLLIAILYGVFINRLQQRSPQDAAEKVTLQTLKETLSLFPAAQERELICTEPCRTCTVYLDGKAQKETAIPLFETAPTVWKTDRYGQWQAWEFTPLFDENQSSKPVCFRYRLARNGSGSSYIVQTDDKHFYVFKPYLEPVRLVASLPEAEKMLDISALLPMERRDYSF